MRTGFAKAILLMMLAVQASIIHAQEPPLAAAPILVIESDRMFAESLFGQRVAAELATLRADLKFARRNVDALYEMNLGGTAIGTKICAHAGFAEAAVEEAGAEGGDDDDDDWGLQD